MKQYIFLTLALLCSMAVFAADPVIYSDSKKGAIKGVDVVAYFSMSPGDKAIFGKDEFTYKWKGADWKFATKENMALFVANPTSYEPQYGGYCAFAISHNFTTDIRPDSWSVIDGKLYLNHNKSSHKSFSKKTQKKIAKADRNWPDVLTRCEKKNNCRK